EVGDLAAAEIEIGAPVVKLVRVEGPVPGAAQPLLPVEPGGLLGEVRLAQVVTVAVPVRADEGDLADFAVVEKFALRFGVMRAAALLQSDLQDGFVGFDGLDDFVAFLPRPGEWLLDINGLAR